ncbi:MAG: aminoacyl-tRNA hydrolase [Granulosicoccus sp.]|nr:aminoacyl-tRNA hydrolase [Granulosicoccus sp.]
MGHYSRATTQGRQRACDVNRIKINDELSIAADDVQWQAVRSRGAGGQNVNKVASAVHLRFDIAASSLPDSAKSALLQKTDKRITRDGVIVIKAQEHRRQDQNRLAAEERLVQLIREAVAVRRSRKPTRPTRSSVTRRLDSKTRRSKLKAARKPSGGRWDPDQG